VYYNYRYYNPKDGRWINRDPIAEEGGWDLYGFVDNNPIDNFDIHGRSTLHGAAAQAIAAAFRTGNLTSLRSLARLGKDQRVCDALKTLESTARTLISKSRGGRVNREFPSQYYEKAYHQIIKEANAGSAAAKKALKLIRDLRFSK
ncbi:RHS repeat-associated core domain-containing protein, partial [Akkermansia muciniphila]